MSSAKKAEERAAEIQRVIAILHKWGIHSLGEFAALEKEEVSNRLGTEAVRMWERASGKATRLLKLVQPPESFVESFEFENEIETSEPLLFILRRFLEQLSLRLGALYFVAKDLRLQITFSDKKDYEHRFHIPQPSNNLEVLFRMLHNHLENFKSDAPIIAVSLEAEPTKAGQQQFSLFESALRDPAQLCETLASLVGLLGAERVGTPVMEETYRPDVFRMEPFAWELPQPNETLPEVNGMALRRFRPAPSAVVFLEENKPVHLRSAGMDDQVVERDGPFMSSGNWWDQKTWVRAEWDLELANDVMCRCHVSGEQWRLDGIYD